MTAALWTLAAWLAVVQLALAARVLARMARSAGGERVRAVLRRPEAPEPGAVAVLLPVLDERDRIGRCLAALCAQTEAVREILVVDGGSRDGTRDIVRSFARRDARVRLVAAGAPPPSWTGKAWGLDAGLREVSEEVAWVLCTDADVSPRPLLARSLLAHARRCGVDAFSVAVRQVLPSAAQGLLHPALLTTLVVRFGIPGGATRKPQRVQANGQCFFARRALLRDTDAFAAAQGSLCEDVTVARHLAAAGTAVGFYEAGDLVEARMYGSARALWSNWPRSLPLRDHLGRGAGWMGLAEVMLVQALPLPLLAAALAAGAPALAAAEGGLLVARLGILAGTARAYPERPWTYWLSPLADLPAAVRLLEMALRRRHRWRGRGYVRQRDGSFRALEEAR